MHAALVATRSAVNSLIPLQIVPHADRACRSNKENVRHLVDRHCDTCSCNRGHLFVLYLVIGVLVCLLNPNTFLLPTFTNLPHYSKNQLI